jgi:hypothetical protein
MLMARIACLEVEDDARAGAAGGCRFIGGHRAAQQHLSFVAVRERLFDIFDRTAGDPCGAGAADAGAAAALKMASKRWLAKAEALVDGRKHLVEAGQDYQIDKAFDTKARNALVLDSLRNILQGTGRGQNLGNEAENTPL